MKNYEQIRARHAMAHRKVGTGKEGGKAVAKKVPEMIVGNGFLAALAFAIDKGQGYADVFNAVSDYLVEIEMVDRQPMLVDLLTHLSNQDSSALRLVTAESIAYLNYLRRFAIPKDDKKGTIHVSCSKEC